MAESKIIKPGSTVCILGAGQLGKMSAMAAAELGYKTLICGLNEDDPAMQVATERIVIPSFDIGKVARAFDRVFNTAQVVTVEWENVPVLLLKYFEGLGMIVRPSSRILGIAQSRNAEKMLAESVRANPTPWLFLKKGCDLSNVNYQGFLPGILKWDREGYDGKGQTEVNTFQELVDAFELAQTDCVLELKINLAYEVSVLVARFPDGHVSVSPAVKNTHRDGILIRTEWSEGLIPDGVDQEVKRIAIQMANELELEGVLAVEFFVSEEHGLYFNEMAPRPHNSFHGSIEAAHTSQFRQHIQAICGMPPGLVKFHTAFEMFNLIGTGWEDWLPMMRTGRNYSTRFHFYGKGEKREGRKMGHMTRLLPNKH